MFENALLKRVFGLNKKGNVGCKKCQIKSFIFLYLRQLLLGWASSGICSTTRWKFCTQLKKNDFSPKMGNFGIFKYFFSIYDLWFMFRINVKSHSTHSQFSKFKFLIFSVFCFIMLYKLSIEYVIRFYCEIQLLSSDCLLKY